MKKYDFYKVIYSTPASVLEVYEKCGNREENEAAMEHMRTKMYEAADAIAEALGLDSCRAMECLEFEFEDDMIAFAHAHGAMDSLDEEELIRHAEMDLRGDGALDVFWQIFGELQKVVSFTDLAESEYDVVCGYLSSYGELETQDAIVERLEALSCTEGVHEWLRMMADACLAMLLTSIYRGGTCTTVQDIEELADEVDNAVGLYQSAVAKYNRLIAEER